MYLNKEFVHQVGKKDSHALECHIINKANKILLIVCWNTRTF